MSDAAGAPRSAGCPLPAILTGLAGLLGAAGVAISAAAAHRGGGDIAATAGLFCLIHAAVVIGVAAWLRAGARASRILSVGAALLLLGTTTFAGDLALAGFFDFRPFPAAAPLGGGAMLAGWLIVAVGGAVAAATGS